MTARSRTDLRAIVLPRTPNCFLLAPDGFCVSAKPHMVAPNLLAPAAEIWERLQRAVAQEPRVTVHDQDRQTFYLDFTQVSLVFRFPDRVTFQLLPAPGNAQQSTLAAYSRSKYGRSDLGVNKARVMRLLQRLQDG
ncbi:MAG TPA: hypothetical protein DCL48_07035 [Alphaproteobacteria bacterium]|nr:hypothetical protein [Alphaproteobacteria bacterium]